MKLTNDLIQELRRLSALYNNPVLSDAAERLEICNKSNSAMLRQINRQKAEIERLQELLKGWETEAYKVADEKDKLYCEAVERVKTTKAEAIKGFVVRLKGFSRRMYPLFDEPIIDWKDIDNLVKEMVGETE